MVHEFCEFSVCIDSLIGFHRAGRSCHNVAQLAFCVAQVPQFVIWRRISEEGENALSIVRQPFQAARSHVPCGKDPLR